MFSIITFEEFISIALDADRTVGIYPEIKDPVFINKHVCTPVQEEICTLLWFVVLYSYVTATENLFRWYI